MAPPTVPGIPARLEKSFQPRREVSRIIFWRFLPASIVTMFSLHVVCSDSIIITRPRNPASEQTRFDPLPIMKWGILVAMVSAQNSGRNDISEILINSSAGPPTPKKVTFERGTFFSIENVVIV